MNELTHYVAHYGEDLGTRLHKAALELEAALAPPPRIEIFKHFNQRGDTPYWDIYVNHHFVSRHNQLCKAKMHALACQGLTTSEGSWHRKDKDLIHPTRYFLEVA